MIFRWLLLGIMVVVTSCDKPADRPGKAVTVEPTYEFLTTLPFQGSPLDILADDMDGDGRPDLAATSHELNYSQIFFQRTPRHYDPGFKLHEVGFHPGDWLRWPVGGDRVYLTAAEGLRLLMGFRLTQSGQMDILSKISSMAPRNLAYFKWPGWGDSLVATPFEVGMLELFGGFDPIQGTYDRKVRVDAGGKSNSIQRVERVTLADIDGDGVDEILFASRTTGEIFKVSHPVGKAEPKTESIFKLGHGAPHQVIAEDLNGDHANDLIIPNQIEPIRVNLLLNDGKGLFRQSTNNLTFPIQKGIRYADYRRDKDDKGYLAVVGFGGIALYQFTLPWSESQPVPVHFIRIGNQVMSSDILLRDMDADGWLDIVVGYGSPEHGIAIVHGPLWEHMQILMDKNFVLK